MFKDWDNCVRDGVATINCLPIVFLNLLSALLMFAGLTALVMFITGGFKFMNSSGDPKKIEGAINNFKFGIIGLAIVLASFVIINIISQVTGVGCIKTFGFGCQ